MSLCGVKPLPMIRLDVDVSMMTFGVRVRDRVYDLLGCVCGGGVGVWVGVL